MAARWKHHNTGLLTVELPSDWTAEEYAPGVLLLRDHEKRLTLGLSVYPPPSGAARATPSAGGDGHNALARQAERDLSQWVTRHGKVHVRQRPRAVGGANHVTCTIEGAERQTRGLTWWQRWLRRGPVVAWRFWAVNNSHLTVLASCSGRPEVVEQCRPTVDRIIATLQLPERALLVGRTFTETVVDLARDHFPKTAVALVDDGHLRFGSSQVDLVTLHRRYLAAPDQLAQHVRAFFLDLQRLADSGGARKWLETKEHILPCLVETDRLERYGPQCVHEEWVNDLHIVFVVQEGERRRSVRREECTQWGVDIDQLHEQAVENLVNRGEELTMEASRADGYTMLAISTPDPYNAARILLPDLHRKLREHLGMTFFVAIPSREFLLAFTTTREDVLARVRRQIIGDYDRMDHPVSPKLFMVTPDGITGDPREAEDMTL